MSGEIDFHGWLGKKRSAVFSLRVCISVDCALVFPSLLLEGSSSTSMNGFCVTSLKVKGVNVFKKLTTR